MHLVLLYIVVHGASIDIDDLRRARYAHDLHVFATTRTPDFIPENQSRLRHTLSSAAEQQCATGPLSRKRHCVPGRLLPTWSRFLNGDCESATRRRTPS